MLFGQPEQDLARKHSTSFKRCFYRRWWPILQAGAYSRRFRTSPPLFLFSSVHSFLPFFSLAVTNSRCSDSFLPGGNFKPLLECLKKSTWSFLNFCQLPLSSSSSLLMQSLNSFLFFLTEPGVRSELMEQVPHIAMYCQEFKAQLEHVVPNHLLPMVVKFLTDSNNQV